MKNLNKIYIQKITEVLMIGGKSSKTILNYTCAINRFLKFFSNQDVSALNEADIILYIKKHYLDKGYSGNTYNMNISAIKFFYSICFNKELNNKLLPHSKLKKKLPTIINKETFCKILDNEESLAHKCWLLLAFCSGLRAEEIARLKIENINSKEHKLKVLGKGKKERFTVLTDTTIKYLRLYFKKYYYKDYHLYVSKITKTSGYLFKGNCDNEHISSSSITNYFINLKKKYNLDESLTFHSLRHSFATNFVKNGGDVFVLKSMLGHSSLNTTSIYVHVGRNLNNLKGINYDHI